MECRVGCGACCIAPSINRPFKGMPNGKPAGERCVHLNEQKHCDLFGKPERPDCCSQFAAEPAICGENFEAAMRILHLLEASTE